MEGNTPGADRHPINITAAYLQPVISRLPHELLIAIFRAALQLDGTYYDQITRLRLVGRRWNDLIEASPVLWSYIDYITPLPVSLSALIKSKQHPLTIRIVCHFYTPRDTYTTLLERIGRHMPRWYVVTLQLGSAHIRDAVQLLGSPAPALQKLSLAINDGLIVDTEGAPPPRIYLFGGQADQLTDLLIEESSCLRWDLLRFPNLRSLNLQSVTASIPDILGILSSAPLLGSFELSHLMEPTPTLGGFEVTMEHLVKLILMDVRSTHTRRLLSLISLPSCRLLRLFPFIDDTEPGERLADLLVTWLPRNLHDDLLTPETLDLRRNGSIFSLFARYKDDAHQFSLELSGQLEIWPFIQRLSNFFRDPRLSLTVINDNSTISALGSAETQSFLPTLNNMERLSLWDVEATEHLMTLLSAPPWLSPNLKHLSFTRTGSISSILNMMRSRYASRESSDTPVVLELLAVIGFKKSSDEEALRQFTESIGCRFSL